jgi:uncharacterized protein YbaR (Trm112 family)
MTSEEYFQKVKEKYGSAYEYDESSYRSQNERITLICKKHGVECHASASNHLYLGTLACPQCKKEKTQKALSLTTEEFITRAKNLHGGAFDYSKSILMGYHDKIEIVCKKHGPFWQNANDHLSRKSGRGCPECKREISGQYKKLSFEEYIARVNVIHNSKYMYIKPRTWRNTQTEKIEIICPIHGSFIQRVGDHLYLKCGCPTCCESLGEKAIAECLRNKGILFEREKTFDWLINPKTGKQLPVDFYIDALKLVIEVDGGQHRYPVEHFGGKKAFESNKYKDRLREDLCYQNGITLIRIFYSDRREVHKTTNELQNYFRRVHE